MKRQLTGHKLRNFLFISLVVILFFIIFAPIQAHASSYHQGTNTYFKISKEWDSSTVPEPVDITLSVSGKIHAESTDRTDRTFPDQVQVYYSNEYCGTAEKYGDSSFNNGKKVQNYTCDFKIPFHFTSYDMTTRSSTIDFTSDNYDYRINGISIQSVDDYNTGYHFWRPEVTKCSEITKNNITEVSRSHTEYDFEVSREEVLIQENDSGSLMKDQLTITNSPKPPAPPEPVIIPTGKLELTAAKTVNNETPDQSYTFCLLDSDGNILQTKQNDSGGIIRFDPIHYGSNDIGKEFSYQVIEQSGSDENMTYDSSVYTVNVTPHQDPDDPWKIIAAPTITKDGQEVSSITFNNIAGPSEWYGSLDLSGLVLLDGAPASKPFLFELKDESGNVLDTAKNNSSGIFTFSAIEYDQEAAGNTYTYTVTQVDTGKNVVDYDGSIYTVTVRVDKSDQDGVLHLQKKIKTAGPVSRSVQGRQSVQVGQTALVGQTASASQSGSVLQTASASPTASDRQNQVGALSLQQEILKDGEPADRIVYENSSVKTTTHKETPKAAAPAAPAKAPKTGDHASPFLWSIVLIAAAVGLRIVLRKKDVK